MANDSGVRWKMKLCCFAPRMVAISGVALLTTTRDHAGRLFFLVFLFLQAVPLFLLLAALSFLLNRS